MEEERRKLEEERKASLEMMKELQALKAQLAAQGATELSGPEDKSEEK